MRSGLSLFVVIVLMAGEVLADEGMWLFNQFPISKVSARYNFKVTEAWLEHVQMSSVRLGASGTFVSPDGLVLTNQHVAARCIHNVSTTDHDYVRNGFYALTQGQEIKCPNVKLTVLQKIEDVTEAVNEAVKPGVSAAEVAQAQGNVIARLESNCAQSKDRECDVVTLYAGAVHHLYEYKRYVDVRLVFAPEMDAAFFGGDPDNFVYPRYALDIAFFRAYENERPARSPQYLKWSKSGVRRRSLVFVSGNPGSTERSKTMAQLEFLRDVEYPFVLNSLSRQIAMLERFDSESSEKHAGRLEEVIWVAKSF